MRALLVIVAFAALLGCRTRLPVDPLPPETPLAEATQDASDGEPGVAMRWRRAVDAVTEAPAGRSRYHREITPDRLGDFLRHEPYRERPGFLPRFFLDVSPVCLPHH